MSGKTTINRLSPLGGAKDPNPPTAGASGNKNGDNLLMKSEGRAYGGELIESSLL